MLQRPSAAGKQSSARRRSQLIVLSDRLEWLYTVNLRSSKRFTYVRER